MFRKVRWTLVATSTMMFVIPWENLIIIPGIGTISAIAAAFAVGLYLAVLALYKKSIAPVHVVICITIYFGYSIGSIMLNTYLNDISKINLLFTYIFYMLVFYVVFGMSRDIKMLSKLSASFSVGCVVAALYNMYMYYTVGPLDKWNMRLGTDVFNPNGLAVMMALGLGTTFCWYYNSQYRIKNWILILYVALSMYALVLTGSRGGFIAYIIPLLILGYWFMRMKSNWSKKIVITMFTICVMLFTLRSVSEYDGFIQGIDRLYRGVQEVKSGNISHRGVIWKVATRKFEEQPILGHGSGSFRYVVAQDLGTKFAAHNSFVAIAVENGIIGLSLFMIFILMIIYNSIISKDEIGFVLKMLTSSLFVSINFTNVQHDKILWVVIAIILASGSLFARKETYLRYDHGR